ncbi:unnamed protein product [Pleuronectes platessa]|uniref:Uncharacterized protein n=1 Tax=Pleuronectes platessa TaxID=8262 RepID=A0A9N7VG22_PLEPL|nr:unnamed protein product [Pleuronectes platessa]
MDSYTPKSHYDIMMECQRDELSQLTWGESKGTPWRGHQCITGPTHRDNQQDCRYLAKVKTYLDESGEDSAELVRTRLKKVAKTGQAGGWEILVAPPPHTDKTDKKHKGGGNTVDTLERRDSCGSEYNSPRQTIKKISKTTAMALEPTGPKDVRDTHPGLISLYTTNGMSPELGVTNIYTGEP